MECVCLAPDWLQVKGQIGTPTRGKDYRWKTANRNLDQTKNQQPQTPSNIDPCDAN